MGRGRSKKGKDSQLHKVAKKPGQGVRLNSQTRAIVERVRQFFEKESRWGYSIKPRNPARRTAEATQLSRRNVDRIHKEYLACDGQL